MPQPFDLEKAKAGHPLVTRDGRKAKFVAHVPECDQNYRVMAYIAGYSGVESFNENGALYGYTENGDDLFLADPPKVKKSLYVAVIRHDGGFTSDSAKTKEAWETNFPKMINHRLAEAVLEWEEEA